MRSRIIALGALMAALVPSLAWAHEVYVLTPAQIQAGIAAPAFNEAALAWTDFSAFAFWAFVGALMVFVVFFASISHALEKRLDPLLARLRRYAAPIARITIGLSFLAAAYYQASYGPELPLRATFGAYSGIITIILIVIGVLITLGIYARAAALVALALFTIAVWYHGIYMLTYTNYLGEIIVLLILGTHHGAFPRSAKSAVDRIGKAFAPYSFLALRVCFGVSLFYASFYAKILHNDLALQVASLPLAGHALSIASALGFEPHFLVLGAAIVELLIAIFFILGIEVRFTALFLLFWLSLSLWWFGEVVWPHIVLIGIPIAFICWGYDKYSLEGWLFKKGAREPVL
jgi:uncharacterized membrane protein YphA (DoxX/SURF4 family)